MAAGVALLVLALAATPAGAGDEGEAELLGPLRIRDMTPFDLLRLDMLPAHAVAAGPGSWAVEAHLSYTNTFVMSENVRSYLERRQTSDPLTQADVDAILGLGEDAYYVDGEFGLLDLTLHYGITHRTSVYLGLSAYDYTGGFLDGTIESFHETFGFGNGGRELVARDRSQAVLSLGGQRTSFLEPPTGGGLGDPVVGVRYVRPLGWSWSLVLDGAAKLALGGERSLLSTGSNDFGFQASLQRKFTRQAIYVSTSFVRTDGHVLGVDVASRVVPKLSGAYEFQVGRRTSLIVQLDASESTVRDTAIDEIKADKYQASLGVRSRRGRLVYGFALTENLENYENTPDIGASLTLAWISLR